MFLWVKAFHVIFVVSWFAGLFYLPRLFVYHCEVTAPAEQQRFQVMERRLYGITTIAMIGAWVFAIWMLLLNPGYFHAGWFHAKLTLAIVLSGYHGWLKSRIRRFAAGTNTASARFYRWINEVPALLLVAIVILVIVKPF